MFQLDKTIVSEDIFEKEFVCNLSLCKGKCCVEGAAGAPLEESELETLMQVYPKVKPFLRKEGIEAIAQNGLFLTSEGEHETMLVNDKECVFVIFDEKNTAKCGIEAAFNKGEIEWQKPISCHLYPVRIMEYSEFTAINYHSWPICDDACVLGKELQMPVYKFLKASLTRKFGEVWYKKLEKIALEYNHKPKQIE